MSSGTRRYLNRGWLFGVAGFAFAVALSLAAPWSHLLAFLLAFFAMEAVPLRLPRGSQMSFAGGVAVASIAILSLPGALAVQLGGQALAAAISEGRLSASVFAAMASRRAAALVAAFSVASWAKSAFPNVAADTRGTIMLLLISGLLYMAVDVCSFSVLDPARASGTIAQDIVRLTGLVGWAYLSQVSVGIVFVVVKDGLGLLAAPILMLLMLLLQSSFALLLRVRTAYVSTVTALGMLSERQAPEYSGHAARVARLCVAAGRQMRLSHERLEALSFAATLHDVGYLKLEGAAYSTRPDSGLDPAAAEVGASIIESVDFLSPATMVLQAHASFMKRTPESIDEGSLLLAALLEAGCLADRITRSRPSLGEAGLREALSRNALVGEYPAVASAILQAAGDEALVS